MKAAIVCHGSITTMWAFDAAAIAWCEERLISPEGEPATKLGTNCWPIETRFVPPIIEGFIEDGGELEDDGEEG